MLQYFLRIGPHEKPLSVWRFDETTAQRLGTDRSLPGAFFEALPGQTVLDAIRQGASDWFGPNGANPFHRIDLGEGQYYPRIARPYAMGLSSQRAYNPTASADVDLLEMSIGQLIALTAQLDRICQTVHPVPENLDVYGHDIRNLTILACTEVEAHWRGVLVANGVDASARLTRIDYVQLASAMRLGEYSVRLFRYPWLRPIAPFAGWGTTNKPLHGLRWYDAYNAVKHDRENEFHQSALRHALSAITACYVMIAAQFGMDGIMYRNQLNIHFDLTAKPSWTPAETYIEAPSWRPIQFPFKS